MTLEIEIKNQLFILHNSGAIYWVEKKLLLISDVHLGKISHFRKHGSALPTGPIKQNFLNLDEVIAHFKPDKICFLGDLFHSNLNKEWILFAEWVKRMALPTVLVAGNHDIIDSRKYEALGIKIVEELIIDDFFLTHYPSKRAHFFNLSGHLHPAVVLTGVGRQFLKLSCFFRSSWQMVLPAFGEFTGNFIVQPETGDIIYVITPENVMEI